MCLVAETGSKPETALVLSVAPLMGAEAELDERHPRWLHVQARLFCFICVGREKKVKGRVGSL